MIILTFEVIHTKKVKLVQLMLEGFLFLYTTMNI